MKLEYGAMLWCCAVAFVLQFHRYMAKKSAISFVTYEPLQFVTAEWHAKIKPLVADVDVSIQQNRDHFAGVAGMMHKQLHSTWFTGDAVCVSAIEVGVPIRAVMMKKDSELVINPRMVALSEEKQTVSVSNSVTGRETDVTVHKWIEVEFLGNLLQSRTEKFTGVQGICLQVALF